LTWFFRILFSRVRSGGIATLRSDLKIMMVFCGVKKSYKMERTSRVGDLSTEAIRSLRLRAKCLSFPFISWITRWLHVFTNIDICSRYCCAVCFELIPFASCFLYCSVMP
jgi:hypothetical protein